MKGAGTGRKRTRIAVVIWEKLLQSVWCLFVGVFPVTHATSYNFCRIGETVGTETMVTDSVGTTKVTMRLFGEVTEERLARESAVCRHRADQLGHVPAKKKGWASEDMRGMRSVAGRHGDDLDGIDWLD